MKITNGRAILIAEGMANIIAKDGGIANIIAMVYFQFMAKSMRLPMGIADGIPEGIAEGKAKKLTAQPMEQPMELPMAVQMAQSRHI